MSNISGPPPNSPKDPFEHVRTQKIEADKRRKEEEEELTKGHKKKAVHSDISLTYFVLFFKKILSRFVFSSSPKEKPKQIFIYDEFKEVMKAFEKLKTIDYSQDVEYLHYFSNIWHRLLENSFQFKKEKLLFTKVENFIESVQKYPENDEHSLGYYLTEYAGSDWLPFPFMEILQNLHFSHQTDPHNSYLSQWVKTLKEIISKIQSL